MKTLTELNSKLWYRLVKVLYCIVFLTVTIMIAGILYFDSNVTQVHDVYVTCLYGNKSSFNLLHDKGIAIDTYSDYKAVPDALNLKIEQACQITSADQAALKQANIEEALAMEEQDQRHQLFGLGITGFYLPPAHPTDAYQIGGDRVPVKTPWKGIGFALIGVAGCVLLFEIIRRLFYYIVTGKFRPSN